MANIQPHRIKTISEFHRFRGLPRPEHPLISVINLETFQHSDEKEPISFVLIFIPSPLKRDCEC